MSRNSKPIGVQLHRRLAAAIHHDDQNAALIAEHLEAAGELHAAYEWHMRAGAWSTNRDIAAAQLSWERASQVADALPAADPGRLSMRIAPRTALCGNAWRRFHPDMSAPFRELRDLCAEAGDKASLASAMAGMTVEYVLHGEIRQASRLASEYMSLVESMHDSDLTVGLTFAAVVAKQQTIEMDDVLRWTQTVIDLAAEDQAKGTFIMGSPLSTAYVWRGLGRWASGRKGWREDLDRASDVAREADPLSQAAVVSYKYGTGTIHGVVGADDSALHEIQAVLRTVERCSDDMALVLVQLALGISLFHHSCRTRPRGLDLMDELRATCVKERFALNMAPLLDTYLAKGRAERGELDVAVEQLRTLRDEAVEAGNLVNVCPMVSALVESLLARGRPSDLEEAAAAIDRLAATLPQIPCAVRDIYVVRLRTLLAQARGDDCTYRELRDRYRAMAADLGFEGHMAWARDMP